jgi:hypothetical protein
MKKKYSAIKAKGVLIEWFDVLGDTRDLTPIVSDIERDRTTYSARPGFVRKLLPIARDLVTGASYSGGSYLFDTPENAIAHQRWSTMEHRVDGLLFPEQPWLSNFDGFVGELVGAVDGECDLAGHAAKRILVWSVAGRSVRTVASELWPRILGSIKDGSIVSAWLGVNEGSSTIGLVLVCARDVGQYSYPHNVYERLRAVELFDGDISPDGQIIVDRCMQVFTIWLPPKRRRPTPGLWPNSPPLPSPEYHAQFSAGAV